MFYGNFEHRTAHRRRLDVGDDDAPGTSLTLEALFVRLRADTMETGLALFFLPKRPRVNYTAPRKWILVPGLRPRPALNTSIRITARMGKAMVRSGDRISNI